MDTLHTLFFFIVTIGILVSIHEFGHFWVARKSGIKVLRFSVGFGKVLWSYQKNPESTEYALSAIPLGGYVRMVDEREGEGVVKPEDLPFAFNRQSLGVRAAVVAAGPLFNLALAVMLFWLVLVIGETGIKPIMGEIVQGTLAAEAGFVEGDYIQAVNDKPTPTWTETISIVVSSALDGDQEIKVKVKDKDEQHQLRVLRLTESDTENPSALAKRLGFNPWWPKLKPVIGKIIPDSAASAAGLKIGDVIISADNIAMNDWEQWVGVVKKRPSEAIQIVIERNDVQMPLTITPKAVQEENQTVGKIGAAVHAPEDLLKSMSVEHSLSPLAAIPAAFETTYFYSMATVRMMGKMLVGKASVENLSGPISIAETAGETANMGFVHFVRFLAFVSLSLGVLNLLPIPVLDGGHLLFYAVEAVKGSPVSEKIQAMFQQVGLAMLVTLMVTAIFMDIQRHF
jgi:regulator of sigma E protease